MLIGDIDLSSWFEGGTTKGRIEEIDLSNDASSLRAPKLAAKRVDGDPTDWWRMLSLKISNVSAGIFEYDNGSFQCANLLNKPLDLSLILQKSTWHDQALTVRCKASFVDMTLSYSHYCKMHSVIRGNLGQEIDKGKWSNIEKAYDQEVKEAAESASKPVEYASGARHVRFGTRTNDAITNNTRSLHETVDARESAKEANGSMDIHFLLDGFALKFRRDDPVETWLDREVETEYDMILLRVQRLEVSMRNTETDTYSLKLALYRMGLFDLGDHGRLNREKLTLVGERKTESRRPCAFAVLVEDYASVGGQGQPVNLVKDAQNPQLLITMDRVPSSSVGSIGSLKNPVRQGGDDGKVTLIKCMLNCLSVNALIRPFTELGAFLALDWKLPPSQMNSANMEVGDTNMLTDSEIPEGSYDTISTDDDSTPHVDEIKSSSSSIQFQLVAHYPRIFFVADESDIHSRALVLRGYVVSFSFVYI